MILLILVTGGAGLLARSATDARGLLVAYGRYAATWVGQNEIIYMGEGITASVAVSRTPNGVLNYHNAGKVQASSEPQDMKLQRMLGHMTTLIPEHPKTVLVIGCGAGVTAGAVSIDPILTGVTIAEIEPLVPKVVSEYFSEHNFSVVQNPKVRIHLDDARHFLLTTKEKFDAVTSDPLDPWVKGAPPYTRASSSRSKSHLNPGGVVTSLGSYESSDAAVKSEVATFWKLPNGVVFANTINGQGYGSRPGHARSRSLSMWIASRRASIRPTQPSAVAVADWHQLGGGFVRHLWRPQGRHGRAGWPAPS